MARSRRSAYGAPQEGKEVVMTIDRRVFYLGGMLVTFVVAVALGMWMTRRPAGSAAQPAASGQPALAQATQLPGVIDEAVARATMIALGLPESAEVIQSNIQQVQQPQPASVGTAAPPLTSNDPYAEAKAKITPADDLEETLLKQPGTIPLEIPENFEGKAADWAPDVLAKFPDPNVTAEEYRPLQYEKVTAPLEGPRLAITELNDQFTYNYGVVPSSKPAAYDFLAVNVGSEDLLISRVYAACGCTATRIGDAVIDPAGFVTPVPLVLKPGESVRFTVEFDPRAEGVTGSTAKYVQLFTNDATKAIFDPSDPNTHETRFRIVVDPESIQE